MTDLDNSPAGESDDLRADLMNALNSLGETTTGEAPEAPSTSNEPSAAADTGVEAEKAVSGRPRDQQGRFAPKTETAPEQAAAPAQAPTGDKPDGQENAEQPAQDAPRYAPPPGWSPTAKSEFANLSQPVKEAIAKREEEVNKGLAKLQDYKGLEPFAEQARASGVTLAEQAARYQKAEESLAKNPVGSLLHLCATLGVSPMQLVQAVGGRTQQPQEQPQFQAPPQPARIADPRVDQLAQEVVAMRQWREQQQLAPLIAERDAFFANTQDYPYAENLRDDIALLLDRGRATTLPQAYEMAAWANPETRTLLINQQAAQQAAQAAESKRQAASNARLASKSVTGSPHAGASTTPTLADLPLEEQLRAAMQMSMGRV